MNLRLTLEHAAHPQRETSHMYSGGQFVIGRGDDCDWQLDDPDRFVSRKHCIITDESGSVCILDASTDGLFLDGAEQPLGTGNAAQLEHQMRLRVGDFVIRVDVIEADTALSIPPTSGMLRTGFDFGTSDEPGYHVPERPEGLPEKFGQKKDDASRRIARDADKPKRPGKDPFALDLKAPADDTPDFAEQTRSPIERSGGGYFDTPAETPAETPFETPVETPADTIKQAPEQTPKPPVKVAAKAEEPPAHHTGPWPPIEIIPDIEGEDATPPPAKTPPAAAAKVVAQGDETLAALMSGLGLGSAATNDLTVEEIEALGARFRDLVDGLMFLLRTRAQEKQKVRVAQTLIANADVNPLKFLASTDEAIIALIKGRDASYLSGDKAVPGAFRDLADHQVRTWSALQTALRRMIDRFDPKEVERDMEDTGLLETLVAGGRSAKMWQLYQDRYREIAQSAEEKFLGEVGTDFRDAYETERN